MEYRIYFLDKGKWFYWNTEYKLEAAKHDAICLQKKGYKTYIESNKTYF